MNRNQISRWTFVWIVGLALLAGVNYSAAQGTTAFTYQGQLRDGGTNANGTYAMTFKLYDSASGGNQIGGGSTNSTTLVNGLFSVNLDFGNVFNGNARWLDITVTDGGTTQTLSPRVQMLPVPHAIYSASAANLASGTWSATSGTFQGYSNVFGISANNSLVMGLSTNGILVNGKLQADGFSIGNDEFIGSDGNGGIQLNTGNSNANLTINNLTLNGNTIQFPAQSGANIAVSTNGNFIFDNNVQITSLGNITLPVPGGNVVISANNQGIDVNGISLSAANGIILPTSDRNRSITTTTSGIVLDGVTVSQNTGVTLPNAAGNRILLAESQGFYMNSNVRVGGYVNATAFNTVSDRNLKEKFTLVNSAEVLDRVISLPISSWSFKADGSTRHIGPMAQDFYAAFNVGPDDKHIATVDADGVALAAIQGLNEKLKEKDAKIEAMEKRLADLEEVIKSSTHK